jgi:hypothetical protein
MKSKYKVFLRIIALGVLSLTLLLVVLFTGCGSPNTATVIGKTEGIAIPTVNGAMLGWAAWVKAGNATQAQVDAVKHGYNVYYASQLQASNAVDAWFLVIGNTNATQAQVAAASNAVVAATFTVSSNQTELLHLITTTTNH